MTIRRRLLLLLLPALAILMLGGALVDRWIAAASTQDAYDQALVSRALAAAAYVQANAPMNASTSAPGAGEQRFYALTAADGRLLAGERGLPAPRTPGSLAQPAFTDGTFAGRRVRAVSIAVPTAGGQVIVTVAETRARREQTQRVMLFGKLLVDFAELDGTLLVVWSAVYFGLRPLSRLRDEAEAQSRRELRRFDERDVPGELRGLVVAFNRVLELLHDGATAQRRFVADAAHQMRTPVAGLLAQIELLESEPLAERAAAQLKTLQRAAQSVAHSANQLLSLARAEPAAALDEHFEPVALDALVRELIERHLTRADQAGIDLGADARPAAVAGDAWLLEDLLGNLIDNALKYTPRGGHVTVRCGVEGAHAWLEVEDDGPGIPDSERGRVRERFYRRPGAPGYGAGLGLAIVDEIARVHQASFAIGAGHQGRGARMRVRFSGALPAIDIKTASVMRVAV